MREGQTKDRLQQFLYVHMPSEKWHLAHPGQMSPRYASVSHTEVNGQDCLVFDWENILQERTVGLIKETRFTTVPPHVNRDMELSVVYEGTCDFVVDGRTVTLHSGDVIIFDTDVVRSTPTVKGERDIVLSMVFRREFFDSVFLSKLPGSGMLTEMLFESLTRRRRHDRAFVVPAAYAGRAKQLVEFIADEYYFSSIYSEEIIRGYVHSLFLELIRGLYRRAQDQEERQVHDKRLLEVIAYLEAHYKDCTLASLAEQFGYNSNYLGNLLKQQTGSTFSELKLSQQLVEARFLLANTDRSIVSIAEKVGITNMTYFYRKFNERFRMSPKQYRQNARRV